MIDDDLELAGELVREVGQRIAHTSGKDIDTAYLEHVIAATQDTEAKARSPTSTWSGSQDAYHVAGAVANQGLCLLEEVGVYYLAFDTLGERKGSAGLGFDQLDSHCP